MTLYLDHNKLTSLPDSMRQFKNPRWLKLGVNQFTEFPSIICELTALQQLGLSHNNLTEVPASMKQLTDLKELYLGRNKFTKLPSVISQLKSLEVLYLEGNDLHTLPDLSSLQQLRELDVRCNFHLSISPTTIDALRAKGVEVLI